VRSCSAIRPRSLSLEANGFLALAEFDKPINGGNNDEVIDRRDLIFNKLRLWQDRDHDGVSDQGELLLLQIQGAGIVEIGLKYKESKRVDEFGNTFRYRGKVKVNNATLDKTIWDVFLIRG
jgi:hypothetical protein